MVGRIKMKDSVKLMGHRGEDGKIETVVSSRMVAYHFDKRHDHLLRDIRNLIGDIAKSTQDWGHLFIPSQYFNTQNKQNYPEYLLTRDGFSLLVMGFTGAQAIAWKLAYISAFNKMEEELKNKSVTKLPQNYLEALKALVVSEEEKLVLLETTKEQEEQLQLQAPKVDYHDKVLDTTNGLNTTLIAKELGMSPQNLNSLLRDLGIQYKRGDQWFLKAKYQDQGLICMATHLYQGTNQVKTRHHMKWTEKGRKFIHNLVKSA